jgi:hypothetical protein
VEANPLLIEPLRRRFEAEIGDGRYELLGVGIAAEPGEAPFWVCDDHPNGAGSTARSPAAPAPATIA